MQTVIVTNNGYDSILLINSDETVVGAWSPATKSNVMDYLRDGAEAHLWDANGPDCSKISDYGEECGRDGIIDDESRANFWHVPTQMAFRAIYKTGHPQQFCTAIGVTSTSKALLTSTLAEEGISLTDVDIVPVEEETGE